MTIVGHAVKNRAQQTWNRTGRTFKTGRFSPVFIDFRALKKSILPVFIDFHGVNDQQI